MFGSKTPKKDRSTKALRSARAKKTVLKVELDSPDFLRPEAAPRELLCSANPQINQKKSEKGAAPVPGNLEIVLWSKDKSQRLVDFRHSSAAKAFACEDSKIESERQPTGESGGARQVGVVTIKIFECPLKKRNFEFTFLTNDSSQVRPRGADQRRYSWANHKCGSRFDLELMKPSPGKQSEEHRTAGRLPPGLKE